MLVAIAGVINKSSSIVALYQIRLCTSGASFFWRRGLQPSIRLLARPPPAINLLSKHSAARLPVPERPLQSQANGIISNPLKDPHSFDAKKRKAGERGVWDFARPREISNNNSQVPLCRRLQHKAFNRISYTSKVLLL